ncbi:MAG: hypothetical protein PSX42_02330 [bacterium]|nr:hypothetical protein [bacterium]
MKNSTLSFVVLLAFMLSLPVFAQTDNEPEALGLPGDNLNLYAVLEVFQKSKTLEEFEKAINDKESNINNLDLDNDKNIDYIEVVSEKEGDSHSIVLKVAINNKENQDVAVIEVEKNKQNKVIVQIIGDEELYGKDYIIEPTETETLSGTVNPGYKSNETVIINNNTTNNYSTTNNNASNVSSVSAWPVVLFLFSPVYVVYRSPWYWGYYPPYWRPWAPIYYYNYWGFHNHYYRNHYYHRTVIIRNPGRYGYYNSRRNSSTLVRQNRNNGNYKGTYNGRDYKRPVSPVVRPISPTTRPAVRPVRPVNRPSRPTSPTRPITRPAAPTTRPVTRPATRPSIPVARATRQAMPSRTRN